LLKILKKRVCTLSGEMSRVFAAHRVMLGQNLFFAAYGIVGTGDRRV
jgi:hypothetical protein